MPFITKSTRQIAEDALLLLQTNTNITKLSPGGKARAIVDIVSQMQHEAYQEVDVALAKAFISVSTGQFLDLFGVLLGEPRLPSEAARADDALQSVKFYVRSGTFGTINGGNSIALPRGTVVSSRPNGEGITYRLLSPLTLLSSAAQAWASVEATSTGTDYNVGSGALVYHSFTSYTDYLNGSLLVTNVHAIASGKDFESDTNYRYRLTQKVIEAEAGNETSIRLAALSTPGVADVIIKKWYRGIGTFAVVVKSITPTLSQTLLDDVTARITTKKGLGDFAFVRGQKEVGFALKTRVWLRRKLSDDDQDSISVAMEDTVRTYVDNLDLGESLLADRLISELFDVHPDIAGFGTQTNALDEAWIYKPTLLEDNRIPQRLISDYTPASDEERVIIEPSLSTPVTFEFKVGTRPVR